MPKPSEIPSINNINARVYRQIDRVLSDLEELPIGPRERVAALYVITRIQLAFSTLRKGQSDGAGSRIKHYASAFKANDARKRKASARPTIAGIDDDPDFADDSDDAA